MLMSEKIRIFSVKFPQIIEDMKQCQQDPSYHREGDVWKHTLMCCDSLQNVPGFLRLSEKDREIVEWAILLHDIGKPKTSKIEDGKIKTYHHSSVGASLARKLLYEMDLDFSTREEICNLVRCHTKPPHIFTVEDPAYYVIKTSWLCRNDLLFYVSMADMLGRISDDMVNSLFLVEMWKSVCEEHNCFSQRYAFLNSHARLKFYLDKSFQPYYKPFMGDKFDVYLLCGLPGTGKTWYAHNVLKVPLVELDMAREELGVDPLEEEGKVLQLTKEMCREHLRKQTPFAFSATNILRTTRQKWVGLFLSYNARVNIIYLEKPMELVLKQNAQRERVVPENVILSMRSKMEVPNWDEAHNLQYITE